MCKKKDYCYFYEIHMNTLEKLDKNDLIKKKWFAKNNSCGAIWLQILLKFLLLFPTLIVYKYLTHA